VSRIFQRNKGDWWVDFRDAQGARHRKKVGPNRRIAREVLDGILGNVARRKYLEVIEDSAMSFADFAKLWCERVTPTLMPRSRERWFGIVERHLKPAFPGALRAITAADAERYIARRSEAGTRSSTINREITVLKHILRRAVLWEYLSRNQVAAVKPLKERPGRTRFLSVEEVEKLLQACTFPDARSELGRLYLRPFVLIALNTGMRRNEILSLTCNSVDWTNHFVTLETTKNGDTRHVYLNETALETMRSLPTTIDAERLFPFRPWQITMAFRRAAKRAGIEDFRLHDLRHTFASYQAMAGVQARGLQALLGHKDNRMTMRYSHLADTYLRDAVNRVNLGAKGPESSDSLRDGTYLAPSVDGGQAGVAK
jgi:integrase